MDDGVIPVTTTDIPVDALVTPSGLIPISPAAMERCHWLYSSFYWSTFFSLVQVTHKCSIELEVELGIQIYWLHSLTSYAKNFSLCRFQALEDSVCPWNAKVYLAVKSVMALWHWKQWWFNLLKSQLSIYHSKCQFSLMFSGAFDVWSLVLMVYHNSLRNEHAPCIFYCTCVTLWHSRETCNYIL